MKNQLATLPNSFIHQLKRKDRHRKGERTGARIPAGTRNQTLAGIAGYLRRQGLDVSAIAGALSTVNESSCNPALDETEVERIAKSIGSYETGYEEAFRDMADVVEEEVKFLADPYVVKGATTVLDGHMGQGKSTFTTSLAAAVSTGKSPPFLKKIEKGRVLFMSAEDDAARALKPRLSASGADVSKIRYQEELFSLDARGMLLRQEVENESPILVIIDPIIAFMEPGMDGNKANETMRFMVELDSIAREFDISILIVRHLRKSKAEHAMHQGIGSIAISARVRSGLILGIHPDDPRKRTIVHAKANYSEPRPAIVFELENTGPKRPPKVKWHPVDGTLVAEDLKSGAESLRGRPNTERETAMQFLRDVLDDGPIEKTKLDVMADARCISIETLRRAGEDLNIKKSKKGRKSVWSLPEKPKPPKR